MTPTQAIAAAYPDLTSHRYERRTIPGRPKPIWAWWADRAGHAIYLGRSLTHALALAPERHP